MAAILYKAGYAENILLTGMVGIADAGKGFYKSPRTLFFLKGISKNTPSFSPRFLARRNGAEMR